MKKLFFILFLTLFVVNNSKSSTENFVMSVGEELIYKVSFLGINLGTIRIVTEKSTELDDKKVYKAKCYLKSADGIPFVSINAIFDTWIDPSVSYSYKFEGRTQDKNKWQHDVADFEYDRKVIQFNRRLGNETVFNKSFNTDKKWTDGLSLFFFPRKYLTLKKSIKIPTFIEGLAYTTINFNGDKIENVEIDKVDYPIRTIYFNGKADYNGVYGFSGNFEGWFTDDEARIPVKAKMKVLVGNVLIELQSWKRTGWKPPKA
jgi:hypothetical protein